MRMMVMWISAYVTNNLLLCLPSRGLTICMAARHAERERANNAHLGASRCFLVFEEYAAPAQLLWGMDRDKEEEKRYAQGHLLFQTSQVTLFIYLFFSV